MEYQSYVIQTCDRNNYSSIRMKNIIIIKIKDRMQIKINTILKIE